MKIKSQKTAAPAVKASSPLTILDRLTIGCTAEETTAAQPERCSHPRARVLGQALRAPAEHSVRCLCLRRPGAQRGSAEKAMEDVLAPQVFSAIRAQEAHPPHLRRQQLSLLLERLSPRPPRPERCTVGRLSVDSHHICRMKTPPSV